MPERAKRRLMARLRGAAWAWALGGGVAVAWGCGERDRLTFPTADDDIGPVTFIDSPNGPDTTIVPGPVFLLSGRTIDPDGVDTVYYDVTGGSTSFPPSTGGGDTVRFALPIPTEGLGGETLHVRVLGVDSLGNRGDAASRRLFIGP